MKRKAMIIAAVSIALLAVGATAYLVLNEQGDTDDDLMMIPPVDEHHVNIRPVNPGKAEEIRIDITKDMEHAAVSALPTAVRWRWARKWSMKIIKK